MEHQATNFIAPEPPPPIQAQSRNLDVAPIYYVLALIAIISLPALVYTFLYSLKCPSPTPPFRRRSPPRPDDHQSNKDTLATYNGEESRDHVKVTGNHECPVCLSVLVEGEQVKQLSVCKHLFHVNCIDLWLNSHSSCPVCRATIRDLVTNDDHRRRDQSADSHRDLPDASNLV